MKLKFTDEPVAYTEFVKAALAALVVLGVIHLTGVQVAGIAGTVTALLGLLVRSQVTPTSHVAAEIDAAKVVQKAEIHDYLAAASQGANVGPVEAVARAAKNSPPVKG